MRVGEPSSDSGIRGLSTNFAFLRGAKNKKKRQREGGKGVGKRGEQKGRKERRKRKEKQREREGKEKHRGVMSKGNSRQQMEALK